MVVSWPACRLVGPRPPRTTLCTDAHATSDTVPAQNLLALIQSLRSTPPRLILSPPTQPRRASVALILRMRPAPDLVFEGNIPEGYVGPVIPTEEFGVGLPFEEFLRLSMFLLRERGCGLEADSLQTGSTTQVRFPSCYSSAARRARMRMGRVVAGAATLPSPAVATSHQTSRHCTLLCVRRGKRSVSTWPRATMCRSVASTSERSPPAWASACS